MLVGHTEKNFDIDLRYGHDGEKLVHSLLSGGYKVEVKTDRLAHSTGNLAIEYKCRGKWSGISTTQADWWAFKIKRGGDDGLSEFVLVPLEDILYFDHVMLK